jgi:hypothetical protein
MLVYILLLGGVVRDGNLINTFKADPEEKTLLCFAGKELNWCVLRLTL